METPSKPVGSRYSSKYFYWHEVEEVWQRGMSVLLFQHFARQQRGPFASRLAQQLHKRAPASEVITLTTANVVYLLGSRPEHKLFVHEMLRRLAERWGTTFEVGRGDV
jgi:hypothetical protein